MMEFQLPTFERCMEIVEQNDAFLHKVEEVDGYKFHIFSYRLASYEDFKRQEGSLEMRGLTFVGLEDLSGDSEYVEYHRFLHLHKFFNYGEQAGFEGIGDSAIQSVQTKEDGSMIVPILWNDKIHCKTKNTFFSEQAEIANRMIAENEKLEQFIRLCYDISLIPIFEFTSPFNQIVLLYDKPELRLIQVRGLPSGGYVDIEKWAAHPQANFDPGVKVAERSGGGGHDLAELIELAECATDMEGWVVQFENGHMVKVKTEWYVALHHLLTENLTRENEIIFWVLNETLDDVLGQVPETDMRRDYALDIAAFLRQHVSKWVDEIEGIMVTLDPRKKNSRKDFAITYTDHRFFGVLMRLFSAHESGVYEQETIFECLKEALLKQTKKWGEAQEFLRKLGFTSDHLPVMREE